MTGVEIGALIIAITPGVASFGWQVFKYLKEDLVPGIWINTVMQWLNPSSWHEQLTLVSVAMQAARRQRDAERCDTIRPIPARPPRRLTGDDAFSRLEKGACDLKALPAIDLGSPLPAREALSNSPKYARN